MLVLLLTGLSRRYCRSKENVITIFPIEKRSDIGQVICLHSRGKAFVEMMDVSYGTRLLNNEDILRLPDTKKRIHVRLKTNQVSLKRNRDQVNDRNIRLEVERCVRDMVKRTIRRYSNQQRRLRILKRKRYKRMIRATTTTDSIVKGKDDTNVCWEYLQSGGTFCPRGDACRFEHRTTASVDILPLSRRTMLASEDRYKNRTHSCKRRVNEDLYEWSKSIPNRRCLVLDGPTCNTARTLRRERHEDVVAVSCCADTVTSMIETIDREGIRATPYFGTIRSYIDREPSLTTRPFGLVYLDYCCTLKDLSASSSSAAVDDDVEGMNLSRAGAARRRAAALDVESSPRADLNDLIGRDVCDPKGCLLAVTFRNSKADEGASDVLLAYLRTLGDEYNRSVISLGTRTYVNGDSRMSTASFRLCERPVAGVGDGDESDVRSLLENG